MNRRILPAVSNIAWRVHSSCMACVMGGFVTIHPDVVDRMLKVPDAASIAAIHFLEEIVGRQCGGSTGTNVYGAMQLMAEMARNGTKGSLVTLICDAGDRYVDTYHNSAWVRQQGYQLQPYLEQLRHFYATTEWQELSMP